ncbi:MAG: hypothetical protein ACRYFZ_19510 [Janthinobacterium lividum]
MATKDERIIEIIVNGQKANANIKEMESATRALSSQLKTLTPGTAEFVAKSAELREVKSRYDSVKASILQVSEANGFLKQTASQAFGVVLGGGIESVIGKVFELGKSIFDTSAKFETYGAVMKNALGSESAAQKAMAQIQDMAANTPFSVDELTGSYLKFVNRGLKPSMEEMTKLGDIASSQGKSFDQLTEAVLDAGGGEFERLKEFGIKASKSGDEVSLSFKGVQKTVANTPEAINAAILGFGKMEGVAGGMAAIAKTMEGQLSNLGDTADQVAIEFGQELRPVFIAILSTLGFFLGILKELPGFVRENRGVLLALAGAVMTLNAPMIQANALLLYNAVLAKGKVVWDTAVAVSTRAWAIAQGGLNLALAANPIGAVVAVATLLIGAFIALYDKSEKVRGAVAGLSAAFKQVFANIAQAAAEHLSGLVEVISGVFSFDVGKIMAGGKKLIDSFKTLGAGVGTAYNKGYDGQLAAEKAARDQKAVTDATDAGTKAGAAGGKAKADAEAKARLEALKNEEAALKERLAKVKDGSEQEMRLKQQLVTNGAAQELLNDKKTAADKRIILAEAQQQRAKLEQDWQAKNLKDAHKHGTDLEKARKEFHAATLKADQEFEKLKVEAMAEGIDKTLAKLRLERDEELRGLAEKKKAVLANVAATETDKQHLLDQYRQTADMAEKRYQQAVSEAKAKQAEKDRKDEFARLDAEEEEKIILLDNAWLEQKLHLHKQTAEYMKAEQARAAAELNLRRQTDLEKLAQLKKANKAETAEAKKLRNDILKIDGELADGQADSDKRVTQFELQQANERKQNQLDLANSKLEIGATVLDAVMSNLDQESAAYQVFSAARKAIALAEIAINLEKELSNNAVTASTINSVSFGVGGTAWLVVQDTLAIVKAGAAAAKLAGFAQGGFTGAGQGQVDATGHRVAGVVHENEWVAPKWMLQQPKYANVIGYLEAERRGGYAAGGYTSPASLPPSAANGGSQATDSTAVMLQQLITVVQQQNERMNDWAENLGVDYHAGSAEQVMGLRKKLKKQAGLG